MKRETWVESLLILSAVISLIVGIYAVVTNLMLLGIFLFAVMAAGIGVLIIRRREPYEFLHQDNVVDLLIEDGTGRNVLYTKNSRIEALKNGVRYYVEDMSADGYLNSFRVSPGVIEGVRHEEGKILVTTTFGRELKRGEQIDREFSCIFRDSFRSDKEYWVQRQTYPGKRFRLVIRFPPERPYKDFRGTMKRGTYEMRCDSQARERIIDGRPCLIWEIESPCLKDSYKLEWTW